MSYLRWIKEMNLRLAGRSDVINLAGSAFQLPEATRWLEEELSEHGASLVSAKKQAPNEFGLPELKDAIRAAYQVPAEREILLTGGASGAIRFAYQLLLLAGGPKHLVVEQPVYQPLLSVARRMGAVVELAPRGNGASFVDEVAKRLTRETTAVVITHPHNPSGELLERSDLRLLVDLVKSRTRSGVLVIDETFADLSTLVGWSTGNLDERIVTISGLTKAYGLGSLRCGWTTVDSGLFPDALDAWIDLENIGSPWLELLAARAIEQFDVWRPAIKANLAAVRRTVSHWLDGMRGAGLLQVEAIGQSATLFARVSSDAAPLEFVERLIEEHHVLAAPGEFFLPTAGSAIRVGYGGDPDDLAEGLARLAAGLRAMA